MPQKYDTFICDNDFTFDVSPRFISNDYGKNSKELDGTYRRHTVDEGGRIQREVPIHFEMEKRTPMRARSAPEFQEYFNLIWKELNTHG